MAKIGPSTLLDFGTKQGIQICVTTQHIKLKNNNYLNYSLIKISKHNISPNQTIKKIKILYIS